MKKRQPQAFPALRPTPWAACLLCLLLAACGGGSHEKKGDWEAVTTDTLNDLRADETRVDSLDKRTQPRDVLMTGIPQYRLLPIVKLNWDPESKTSFVTSIDFRSEYHDFDEYTEEAQGPRLNNWHNHVVPGYEAACGYNIVNVAHWDQATRQRKHLFDSLVLVKTLYFPTAERDTLDGQPVRRRCYMVSVFDEDTNEDGFVNQKDLRRFYHFALPGLERTTLVPRDHGVVSATYDHGNDFLFVFARRDGNANGVVDVQDDWHIFWVDMKDPKNNGQVY